MGPMNCICWRFLWTVPVICLSLILLIGCGQDNPTARIFNSDVFDQGEFSSTLQNYFSKETIDTSTVESYIPSTAKAMYLSYEAMGFKPIWCSASEGVGDVAVHFFAALDSLRYEGLNPEIRYHLSALKDQAAALKDNKDEAINYWISFDTTCTAAYLLASKDLLLGIIKPAMADSLWHVRNDTLWEGPQYLASCASKPNFVPDFTVWRSSFPEYAVLRKDMEKCMVISKDSAFISAKVNGSPSSLLHIARSEMPWYENGPIGVDSDANKELIKAYQHYKGIKKTGLLDEQTIHALLLPIDSTTLVLAANMERLRWLPKDPGEQYIFVNIPLMEMVYRREGADNFKMRVVVGRKSRQTPSLSAPMVNVLFNPPWGVPPTILKRDVLPGITRSGAAYLARKGLKAYDRHGKVVSGNTITSGNYKNYFYKQEPGTRNALGEVKFNLPNPWDIYLHDTPHREDFPKEYRALSSGCIRVEKPKEFAAFLLHELDGRGEYTASEIDSIIQTRKTKTEKLKTTIPVHIVYLTASNEEETQLPRFLPDIYGKDEKLLKLLR